MNVLLVAVLVVPALGALVAVLVRDDRAGRIAGTVAAALALVASALLALARAPAGGARLAPWHEIDVPWAPAIQLRFHVGVDGVSYPLVVLTALLTLLCCLYSLWQVPGGRNGRHLVALLLVVEVGIVGVFLALDLVLFFVFFELVLLPMYAIIAGWGGAGRRGSACWWWSPAPVRPTSSP
jgi:NADH-quinone oxidoreductase subunit M